MLSSLLFSKMYCTSALTLRSVISSGVRRITREIRRSPFSIYAGLGGAEISAHAWPGRG
jgi:hypothetical protein